MRISPAFIGCSTVTAGTVWWGKVNASLQQTLDQPHPRSSAADMPSRSYPAQAAIPNRLRVSHFTAMIVHKVNRSRIKGNWRLAQVVQQGIGCFAPYFVFMPPLFFTVRDDPNFIAVGAAGPPPLLSQVGDPPWGGMVLDAMGDD